MAIKALPRCCFAIDDERSFYGFMERKPVELLINKAWHTSYGPENNAAPAVGIHGKERRDGREERTDARRGGETYCTVHSPCGTLPLIFFFSTLLLPVASSPSISLLLPSRRLHCCCWCCYCHLLAAILFSSDSSTSVTFRFPLSLSEMMGYCFIALTPMRQDSKQAPCINNFICTALVTFTFSLHCLILPATDNALPKKIGKKMKVHNFFTLSVYYTMLRLLLTSFCFFPASGSISCHPRRSRWSRHVSGRFCYFSSLGCLELNMNYDLLFISLFSKKKSSALCVLLIRGCSILKFKLFRE